MALAFAEPQVIEIATQEKPLGVDVSRYQGVIDWGKLSTMAQWVYMRCGISWGYEDTFFKGNALFAEKYGVPWGAYHVIYSGQGAQRQADNILRIMGGNFGNLPLALDMEVALNQAPNVITNEILQVAQIIEKESGKKPILYSRANWIDAWTLTGSWRNEFDWWLAQYLSSGVEHAGPPNLPKGVTRDRCIIHQTSDRGNGKLYGVQSASIDLNRWQLSQSALSAFLYGSGVVELTMEERVARLEKAVFG